jgi:FAD:protein FMN transferase
MQEYAYSQKLFGTNATISLVTTTEQAAELIAKEMFTVLAEYEARFSRFLPHSELSELNTKKSLVVSDEFLTILNLSYELYMETAGNFNPLIQVARLGYHASFAAEDRTGHSLITGLYNIDFHATTINQTTNQVTLVADQQLDFGGILKGYVAEKISNLISATYPECRGNIVNLGGDLHTNGRDENGEPFIFNIYNPVLKVEIPLALTDTSLATSGTYARTWETASGTKNHLLARDGLSNPTSEIISASVIHKAGATTEAYAKALLIDGNADRLPAAYQFLLINKAGLSITNLIV